MAYQLPPLWMPNAIIKRVVLHWTGGSYTASETDLEHYNFVIEGDGDVRRGEFPLTAQHPPLIEGRYAAHTKGTNSYAAGVSICAMGNAQEVPFKPGKYPILRSQWEIASDVVAALCVRYRVLPTPQNVLTHAEVQRTLGIAQRQKWDITRLVFEPNLVGATAIGNLFRADVSRKMKP